MYNTCNRKKKKEEDPYSPSTWKLFNLGVIM